MDRARLRVLLLAVASLALLSGLPACGNRHEVITDAETEGPYLNLGPLKYQVQISRQLNPDDLEDRVYLRGLPADTFVPTGLLNAYEETRRSRLRVGEGA